MANPYINLSHMTNTTLHEGWLEHKSFHEYKWRRSWFVLQGNALYFFNSQNRSNESPFGILSIDNAFRFVKKDRGSEKAGYKFELYTNRSVTKFKACKFSERELWKAYLEGIAKGQVSDSIDLPPEILVQIRLLLEAQHINGRRSSLTDHSLGDSADSVPDITPYDEDDLCYTISNDATSADSGCVDDFYLQPANSHLLNYVFYNDAHRKELPSWFFQNCSRERAEEILAKGHQFGNTLMRKGSSYTSNLVISKKTEVRKEDSFSHFVIEIQPDGYKLLVENPHQPMKCLLDIMNFFVQTSGALTTKPMTCNNLQKIGISPEHIYNPIIIPNPQPRPVSIQEDSHGYKNMPSKSDNSARPWVKNRSQSSPNILPLVDFRPDIRRLSVSSEADASPSPTTPRPRFAHPAAHPPLPPPPCPLPLPPPPTDNIPFPPPPPPPTSSPPKLPTTSNRSRVDTSTPPPSSQAPAPPLPGNHPPPIKSPLGSTLSLASHFDEITQRKRTAPPVAPKPVTKASEEPEGGKKIGEVDEESLPEDEFKKKLEMMFGQNKSKTMPAIRQQKNLSSGRPDLKSAVTPTLSIPIGQGQDVTDCVYDDLDGYQNHAALVGSGKK